MAHESYKSMNNQQEYIAVEFDEGVLTITFRRPDVLNSFNKPMAKAVQHALDDAEKNLAARAVVLTGEGRAFCAGQDLAEALPSDGSSGPRIEEIVEESYNPIIKRIRKIEKPVIAAVNGVAAGAGANIALACDFVFAADVASFVQSFINIGLVPDSGGSFFLPRLVGMAKATELMMLGGKVSAEEAHRMGMIYRVVSADDLIEETTAFAERLAGMPTKGLGLIKRAINASFDNDLGSQLDLEKRLQAQAGRTEDYLEGVKAFQEKRKPEFRGY